MPRRRRGDSVSALSRSKLMRAPMVSRLTFSLCRIALYSDRISSERSHVKVARSIQSRIRRALGLEAEMAPVRKPEIPAIRTEVSTTPLGRLARGVVNDRDLWQCLTQAAMLPDRFIHLVHGHIAHLPRCIFKCTAHLGPPPPTRKVGAHCGPRKLRFQLTRETSNGDLDFNRLGSERGTRSQRHRTALSRIALSNAL